MQNINTTHSPATNLLDAILTFQQTNITFSTVSQRLNLTGLCNIYLARTSNTLDFYHSPTIMVVTRRSSASFNPSPQISRRRNSARISSSKLRARRVSNTRVTTTRALPGGKDEKTGVTTREGTTVDIRKRFSKKRKRSNEVIDSDFVPEEPESKARAKVEDSYPFLGRTRHTIRVRHQFQTRRLQLTSL